MTQSMRSLNCIVPKGNRVVLQFKSEKAAKAWLKRIVKRGKL